MGRPSALEKDPDLAERIAAKVEQWNDPHVAAQSEGVAKSVYYDWVSKGEDGQEPYASFLDRIARAVAVAEVEAIQVLRSPPLDDRGKADAAVVRAAEWFLERARRERYGQTIEIHQKAGEVFREEIERLCRRLDPEVRRAVLRALAEGAGGEAAGGTRDSTRH